jgi:hypothetical protein
MGGKPSFERVRCSTYHFSRRSGRWSHLTSVWERLFPVWKAIGIGLTIVLFWALIHAACLIAPSGCYY